MIRFLTATFVASLVTLLATGCGDGLTLLPAAGLVTYQGKPVEGASVVFVPDSGIPGTGTTDAAGKFAMQTNGKPGVLAGKHKVTISKASAPAGLPANPTPEDMMKMASAGKMSQSKSEIPTKYAVVQGGLTAEVSADKKEFNFELTD
ncbi:MAG: carboxypeptidase-like regulatory domain-containing protein [Planctomycetaceae bacterium]|nr:carboxypeptidase-like regulatory domain-containing protein [Planctomycetaceae bacterium]